MFRNDFPRSKVIRSKVLRVPRLGGRVIAGLTLALLAAGCGSDDSGAGPTATGSLVVTTSTAGGTPDVDGYAVRLDGGSALRSELAIAPSGSVMLEDVEAGEHDVELVGVAPNCTVSGGAVRTVTVEAGETATVSFSVGCRTALQNRVLFYSFRGGDSDLYTMSADGTDVQRIVDSSDDDMLGAISPDGTRIVFTVWEYATSQYDIYVMNADGSGRLRLTSSAAWDQWATWTPDGQRILFQSNRNGDMEIFSMNADGTGVVNLSSSPGSADGFPVASPDGSRIVFASDRTGSYDIWAMDADGTNLTNLTGTPGTTEYVPAWSPDGTRLLYFSDGSGSFDLFVMNADGSSPINLTNDAAVDQMGAWSPDGESIVYNSERSGELDIIRIGADGSAPVSLLGINGTLDAVSSQSWAR